MAVMDQEMNTKCHEQKFKKEGGVGKLEESTSGADLSLSQEGKKLAEGTVEDDEPAEYKEWRDREAKFNEYLEHVTKNPQYEQDALLRGILEKHAHTEYLQQYGLNGSTDIDLFRERVPISDYDEIRPAILRIMKGETSPILCADPIEEIMSSSGTTNGECKLFPITEQDLRLRGLIWSLMRPVLNRQFPGLEKSKALFFYFVSPTIVTASGHVQQTAVTSFIRSKDFKERPFDPTYRLTSPDEVIEARDPEEAMYCHLLCGLLQRTEVVRMGSIFPAVMVRAIRKLEVQWRELCDDIRNGTLSERQVQTPWVRSSVLPLLRADPELAEVVQAECSKTSEGILKRLWPNMKLLDTVCTGSMEAYLPMLAYYSDNTRVICTQLYGATEGYFGLNLNPICPPEKIAYTLLPTVAFYEFIPVDQTEESKEDEALTLSRLQLGQEYELLVTTVSGLYRYRMGDVLKVVGSHNATPCFQFMQRKRVVLSVDTDKTDEKDLHTSVTKAANALEASTGSRLLEYTSTVDFSKTPGCYVLFWELSASDSNSEPECLPDDELEKCCTILEATLSEIYKRDRSRDFIGPLQLRILRIGTFDKLANYAFSQGTSLAQYKTPRSVKGDSQLEILEDGVYQRHSTISKPPYKIRTPSFPPPEASQIANTPLPTF